MHFSSWLWKKKVFEVKHFCAASSHIFRFVIDSLPAESILGKHGKLETANFELMHFHLHLQREEKQNPQRIKEEIICICTTFGVCAGSMMYIETYLSSLLEFHWCLLDLNTLLCIAKTSYIYK